MLFFLFKKNYIFWLFLFNKKFIISHEKVDKQPKFWKQIVFSKKTKKTNTTLGLSTLTDFWEAWGIDLHGMYAEQSAT